MKNPIQQAFKSITTAKNTQKKKQVLTVLKNHESSQLIYTDDRKTKLIIKIDFQVQPNHYFYPRRYVKFLCCWQ